MSPARRRTVSLSAATISAVLALVVGFGAGYLVRRATASTTTTTTTTTTSTSTTTTTTTTLVPLDKCTGADLAGTVGTSQAAAGTVQTTFTVSNVSGSPCALNGYPELILLNANQSSLPTSTVDGQAAFTQPTSRGTRLANAAPRPQRLTAGGQVTFVVQYSDVPVGSETSCPQSASVNVYPPGLEAATPFNVSASMDPCNFGTVHVSPFFLAT